MAAAKKRGVLRITLRAADFQFQKGIPPCGATPSFRPAGRGAAMRSVVARQAPVADVADVAGPSREGDSLDTELSLTEIMTHDRNDVT
jgi:hypothetical protein